MPEGTWGRVTAVYERAHAVDVVLWRTGRRLSSIPVLCPMISSASGRAGLHAPGTPAQPYDIQDVEGLNVYAAISYHDGIPAVVGFKMPEKGQMTFDRPGFEIDRHSSDVYRTLNDKGELELSFPNGSFLRVGLTPDHEDLTGKDFDKLFAVARNTDAQLHMRLVLKGANGSALDLHVAPDGTATATLSGAATLTAQSWTVHGPVHFADAVTGDSSATFQQDVVGQGVSLHGHQHTSVQSGTSRSGPPG